MIERNVVYNSDCLEGLKMLPDNSIDAIVTDPPYELGFMGKKWDSTGISYNVDLWKECLRVLKPGGHLLSFGGARTYHRMVCAIEDVGFEIRDQIMWIYGSGFPKSHDISKAIDKKMGAERKVVGTYQRPDGTKRNYENWNDKHFGVGEEKKHRDRVKANEITLPATDLAKQWDGWGTALKPAHEPIVMARKPLSERTIVDNVLKWGTGGINIDECRIPSDDADLTRKSRANKKDKHRKSQVPKISEEMISDINKGRFPANVILDEDAGKMLDEHSGTTTSAKINDTGGASRFFYCAKASKKERGEGNNHPTVKPIKLMEYLVTLVTPPNGIVLDPFAGSGTTLLAAKNLGFDYIGFEKEGEYVEIIHKRLA